MKFNIKYRIIFIDNSFSEDHEININNCINSSIAHIKLEKYLNKKYNNFKKLIVDSCTEFKSNQDKLNDIFGQYNPYKNKSSDDILNNFGDIFGFNK